MDLNCLLWYTGLRCVYTSTLIFSHWYNQLQLITWFIYHIVMLPCWLQWIINRCIWYLAGMIIATNIGFERWTSIFQFRRANSRTWFDNIFWFISLLSTTKKKFPKIKLHDSELMTYVHFHRRKLQKLLLHIQYYHRWLEIPMGIWIIASEFLLNVN